MYAVLPSQAERLFLGFEPVTWKSQGSKSNLTIAPRLTLMRPDIHHVKIFFFRINIMQEILNILLHQSQNLKLKNSQKVKWF